MFPRRVALVAVAALTFCLAGPAGGSGGQFDAVVRQVLAAPYQPAYVPLGNDTAFPGSVPNTAPAQDYTSGSIPGSPDFPGWPAPFTQVLLHSGDGAPLYAYVALHAGKHAGVVVVHGFNTHGYDSVVRWAAMLYAGGYDVVAADQRDFSYEYNDPNHYGYPNWLQTFGWKESEDVLAAGRYLASRPGVTAVGVVGFSEGAQNTVLALAQDSKHVFKAGLTFSAPADQSTQLYSTAVPAGCAPPACTYPASSALIALVVPPYSYTDPCAVLADASALYGPLPTQILARESAFKAQDRVTVPLLNVYAQDDPLVQDFQATMMAAYNAGHATQRTVELRRGAHAYFYDRWWQQRAILLYFKALLPGAASDRTIGTTPTVNQTPGGPPAGDQAVELGQPTRAQANALQAPPIC
jgi:alpha-beta hydrolase superfamily lysophospholipase